MRRALLIAAAGAVWAARAACQNAPTPPVPLELQPPAMTAPGGVTGAAAQPPESLTLAAARARALHNHPEVAAASYRALAAQQVFVETRAGLLPQLNLYGSAVHADSDNTRLMAGGLNNPSVFSRSALGGGLSQLVTDFGHTTNLVASS
ncbi:MAG TPA: TolC family protein, partial [Steroidobacteraceae bacterium]|nr:TolC family protein [Steroidobacteraceae bacterium]